MFSPGELKEHRRRKRNAKNSRCNKRRRARQKAELIEARGGGCEDCGYAACVGSLDFHHRDPQTKEFGLGSFTGSRARLLNEAAKCDLLCANCHRLRHATLDAKVRGGVVSEHRRQTKQRAVRYMGSSCFACERWGPTAIFDFHHWDSSEKEFGIGDRGFTHSWDKILRELAKCVMLCANCHREVHAGVRDLNDYVLLGLAEDLGAYAA